MRIPFLSARPEKPKPPVLPPEPPEEEQDDEREPEEVSGGRRRHILAAWAHLKEDVDERIVELMDRLSSGEIDGDQWADAFRLLLTRAHSHAAMIGRNLAGDLGPLGTHDTDAGQKAWDETQESFFASFLSDLQKGKYGDPDGALKERPFLARCGDYLASIRVTAVSSFRTAMGSEVLRWALGDGDHCQPTQGFEYTCQELAKMEPMPAEAWPTTPGQGLTPCVYRCNCGMESEDGSYSTEGL